MKVLVVIKRYERKKNHTTGSKEGLRRLLGQFSMEAWYLPCFPHVPFLRFPFQVSVGLYVVAIVCYRVDVTVHKISN